MLDLEKSNVLKNELKELLHNDNNALKFFYANDYYFIDNYKWQLNNYVTDLIDHIDELQNAFHQLNDIDELIKYNYVIVKELWNSEGTEHDYLPLNEDLTIELIEYMKELQ